MALRVQSFAVPTKEMLLDLTTERALNYVPYIAKPCFLRY